MGFNEAVPCCCNETAVCCRQVTFQRFCATSTLDEANCTFVTGEPDTASFTVNLISCVAQESDCNCDGFYGDTYGGGYIQTACTATYFANVKCQNGQPPVGADFCGPSEEPPCQRWACAPCGPRPDGCASGTPGGCPPVPDCPLQPCCEPPPPDMCCYYETSGNCLAPLGCLPCDQDFGPTVIQTHTQDCAECGQQALLLATTCCSSCGWDPITNLYEYNHCNPQDSPDRPDLWGKPCCNGPGPLPDGCANGQSSIPQTCTAYGCFGLCPSVNPPLCPCGNITVIGPCGNLTFAPSYSTFERSSEGRLETGIFNDGTGFKLDTLFLFGYGYNHL